MGHILVPEAEALLDRKIPVLDHGFVRLVDYMGGDARIVQAARVSYGAGTKSVREDAGLIDYLVRHQHTSPLEHVVIELHCKMPIFVARQWIRHRTARLNEISGRYSVMTDEFYLPPSAQIRRQSADNKQGRASEEVPPELQQKVLDLLKKGQKTAFSDYEDLLKDDIARELARINLPLSLYTEWYWQMDLHNLFHFLALRMDEHAQWEIREYAAAIGKITRAIAPMAYDSFERHLLKGRRFSSDEIAAMQALLKGKENPLTGRRLEEFEEKLGALPAAEQTPKPAPRRAPAAAHRPPRAAETAGVESSAGAYAGAAPETVHGWRVSMTHDEIMALPLRGYNGPIEVVRDDEHLATALKKLKAGKALGFDTESRPSFVAGQNYPVSILQLSTAETAYIIQLKNLLHLAPLYHVLEDGKVIKAGVALDQDIRKLQELHSFKPAGFVDIAKEVARIGLRKSGLRSLAGIMLGFRISKGAQRSNWSNDPLTPSQIAYAATDAWVSRELYMALDKRGLVSATGAHR